MSRQISRLLIEDRLAPPSKVKLIGSGGSNGTNVRRFNPNTVPQFHIESLKKSLGIDADAPVLVYVGRVCSEKGVDLLPPLLEIVQERYPRTVLVIAGPEDARDPPSGRTLKSFETNTNIRRIGFVEDPSPLYAIADLFVFPSFFEGIANVLLEAAAHERVAIGFDVPGVQETIGHGESGILVPKGNIVAMARAIGELLRDSNRRREMGRIARARVIREFSNEVIWRGLDQVFKQLLQARRRPLRTAVAASGREAGPS